MPSNTWHAFLTGNFQAAEFFVAQFSASALYYSSCEPQFHYSVPPAFLHPGPTRPRQPTTSTPVAPPIHSGSSLRSSTLWAMRQLERKIGLAPPHRTVTYYGKRVELAHHGVHALYNNPDMHT
ncbi:hypothetical protein DTO013E5_176 [Penicillium roqueforti]|uniref:uncharacterized protein n=1 Tax=Penicillium roqueforti TaxID=5082 RepID=UPI00190A0E1F|nr:uncharacterized protein LCP9604111_961 [Penicillium roqueforti]KAF9253435.1 hypothetical protein LCP9604111_961 [Penicillium roqueforti]KAI1838951.1 hypothetical protein CBS147337_676 [Penicillium roqueforti]KAI2691432.1 hypothetical protein LCP963914a_1633 [Penicillium roqueforti]KAI2731210.1 hypothetical protein CBS147354_319 [Penicillium roqueforti]KAI2746625.1 hypothetical protein DTO012A1_1456 [Penicillium roqueforti]